MSRSYKKHPFCSDNYADKRKAKRRASKKIRTTDEIANGKQYRKISDSWNIAYNCLYWTEAQARAWYRDNIYLHNKYKNEDEYIKKIWFRDFKSK